MAFGVDDALAAAAAGICLADTCVQTVKSYRKKGKDIDIETLIEEIRVTALHQIHDADLALVDLERTLKEKGVLDQTLQDAIAHTPFWRPGEAHRLKRIRRSFNALADATYSATDDIAALLRCRQQTSEMGRAIVDSARKKQELNGKLLHSASVGNAIDILRTELQKQKSALMQ